MNLAGTRKLARRLHRGEIDETRHAYVGHLERVAALVAAYGGDEVQQMAAWLHGAGWTGLRPRDLAALGVPGRVVQVVAALAPGQPWEPAEARAARVKACRTAAVVLRADVTDLARPQAQAAWGSRWRFRAAELRRLLDLAGIPVPEELLPHPVRLWQRRRHQPAAAPGPRQQWPLGGRCGARRVRRPARRQGAGRGVPRGSGRATSAGRPARPSCAGRCRGSPARRGAPTPRRRRGW